MRKMNNPPTDPTLLEATGLTTWGSWIWLLGIVLFVVGFIGLFWSESQAGVIISAACTVSGALWVLVSEVYEIRLFLKKKLSDRGTE